MLADFTILVHSKAKGWKLPRIQAPSRKQQKDKHIWPIPHHFVSF
jgi:hypothetical protein